MNTKKEKDFTELHKKIVNLIIEFCKENEITNIDKFHLSADGVKESVSYGKWHPCTDSALVLFDEKDDCILSSM